MVSCATTPDGETGDCHDNRICFETTESNYVQNPEYGESMQEVNQILREDIQSVM